MQHKQAHSQRNEVPNRLQDSPFAVVPLANEARPLDEITSHFRQFIPVPRRFAPTHILSVRANRKMQTRSTCTDASESGCTVRALCNFRTRWAKRHVPGAGACSYRPSSDCLREVGSVHVEVPRIFDWRMQTATTQTRANAAAAARHLDAVLFCCFFRFLGSVQLSKLTHQVAWSLPLWHVNTADFNRFAKSEFAQIRQ